MSLHTDHTAATNPSVQGALARLIANGWSVEKLSLSDESDLTDDEKKVRASDPFVILALISQMMQENNIGSRDPSGAEVPACVWMSHYNFCRLTNVDRTVGVKPGKPFLRKAGYHPKNLHIKTLKDHKSAAVARAEASPSNTAYDYATPWDGRNRLPVHDEENKYTDAVARKVRVAYKQSDEIVVTDETSADFKMLDIAEGEKPTPHSLAGQGFFTFQSEAEVVDGFWKAARLWPPPQA
jgi:hypothetical protein